MPCHRRSRENCHRCVGIGMQRIEGQTKQFTAFVCGHSDRHVWTMGMSIPVSMHMLARMPVNVQIHGRREWQRPQYRVLTWRSTYVHARTQMHARDESMPRTDATNGCHGWTARMDATDGRHGWTPLMDATEGRNGRRTRIDATDGRHGWTALMDGNDGRHGWTRLMDATDGRH